MTAIGAGAALDAIARIRQAEREMARRRQARRLRRPPSRECHRPDRLPYPCFFVCAECGRLEPTPVLHPMRHDGQRHEPGPCPGCHARAWIDLQQESLALAYREAESSDDEQREQVVRRRSGFIGAIAGLATVLVVLSVAPLRLPAVELGMLGLVTAVLVMGVAGLLRRRPTRPGRTRPRRWRRPIPPPHRSSPVRQIQHGVVEGEPILHTPVGAEPCLGWAVKVWSDDGLLLDEQRHAPLVVDGEAFEAETITLDLAPRGGMRPDTDDEHFVRFMNERGLSPHDETLRVYESRLMPGVPVALYHHRTPQGAGPVLCQAPRALAT